MRTVGHKLPAHEEGGSTAMCDLCGMRWYRSRLTRKADGLLYCPDDVMEQDKVSLSMANATAASSTASRRRQGAADALETLDADDLTAVHYNRASDWP